MLCLFFFFFFKVNYRVNYLWILKFGGKSLSLHDCAVAVLGDDNKAPCILVFLLCSIHCTLYIYCVSLFLPPTQIILCVFQFRMLMSVAAPLTFWPLPALSKLIGECTYGAHSVRAFTSFPMPRASNHVIVTFAKLSHQMLFVPSS